MKVLIIGANGKSGFLTLAHIKENTNHIPIAMIRNPEQKKRFEDLGVRTVIGDLEYPLADQMNGIDAVIFAAGSGSQTGKDKTVLVDHLGAINACIYASNAKAKRFIMLSSMNARIDSDSRIKHYHRAKAYADKFIMEFDEVMDQPMDWTIVCPGGLTDENNDGMIDTTVDINGRAKTSRANLAITLASCLDLPNTIHKRFAVTDGQTKVAEALSKL